MISIRERDKSSNVKQCEAREEADPRLEWSLKLAKTLGLDASPVAAAIGEERPKDIARFPRRLTACMMIQIARKGVSCCASGQDILCGGRFSLGLGKSPLRNLDQFLVRGERLFGSTDAARRLIEAMKDRAPHRGQHLALAPLEMASFTPDVVLFVGTPAVVSRILFLNAFEDGNLEALHGEPLCSGAIAIPVSTGKIGISFLDMACRTFGRYRPEEMIVGVPYNRLSQIVRSIEYSTAGTAKPGLVLRLAESFLRARVPKDTP